MSSGLPDRLPGRVEVSGPNQQAASGIDTDKGSDSHSDFVSIRPPARVSTKHLQFLREKFSGRDFGVLESVRRYRLLRIHQIRRLHFDQHASEETAERIARRVLKRLTDEGLLVRLERRVGGVRAGSAGHIYSVSPLGHRFLGTPTRKRLSEPSLTFINHTLAVAELGTLVAQQAVADRLSSWEVVPEPESWRQYHDGRRPVVLKPDLAIVLETDTEEFRWFVEVDLGTESSKQLMRQCQDYMTYLRAGVEQQEIGMFPQVLWVVPDQRRLQLMQSVIGETGAPAGLFVGCTADVATDYLRAEDVVVE